MDNFDFCSQRVQLNDTDWEKFLEILAPIFNFKNAHFYKGSNDSYYDL